MLRCTEAISRTERDSQKGASRKRHAGCFLQPCYDIPLTGEGHLKSPAGAESIPVKIVETWK